MRIKIFYYIVVGLFILIAVELFYLQIIRGPYFLKLSQKNATRLVSFDGPRGKIFDAQGKLMAESIKSFDVALIPQDIQKKTDVFSFLSNVLGGTAESLQKKYQRNKLTPFTPVVVVSNLTRQQAIQIEESRQRYPGLLIVEQYERRYPFDEIGSHLMGYIGKRDRQKEEGFENLPDMKGVSGIELFYDEELRGKTGVREIEVNSRGQQVRLLRENEPVAGKDMELSIDLRVQTIVQQFLKEKNGAVVVIDPQTGDVLALASSPFFNPNAFVSSDQRSLVSSYLNHADSPLLNRAISAQFPLGSIFKIIVAAGGLEEKKFVPTMVVQCPGYYQLGDRTFKFSHAYGAQDFYQAMAHSANEYFFDVGLKLGAIYMAHYAKLFGFDAKTAIDLPYEVKGSIPSPKKIRPWYKGDTANMSIGQGKVLVTPIQVVKMMAILETEGEISQLRLVKKIDGKEIAYKKGHLSIRPSVWRELKKSLQRVVESDSGTAKELKIQGLLSYGKTGTAQSVKHKADHSWYAGVTKSEKGKSIAYCVFLEYGGSGKNAVLLMKDILTALKEINYF